MRQFESLSAGSASSEDAETTTHAGSRAIAAAVIGASVLAAVMLLVLLAAIRTPPPAVARPVADTGNISPRAYARFVSAERYMARTTTGVLGSRELLVTGYVRNTGARAVVAADIRCFFARQDAGGEAYLDFPLVVDTRLADLGSGPLPPKSGRDFAVRMDGFPDELSPQIVRIELINLRI